MAIPDTMLAAQVVEPTTTALPMILTNPPSPTQYNKPYTIAPIPTPSSPRLHPHDLLLRVAVASYCHTDGMVSSGSFHTSLPCTASHEAAGIVVAMGSSVSNFKTGDRVMAGIPYHRCGTCADCQGPENYRQYCPNIGGHNGVTRHGGFAEYMVCDARESARVPDKVDFETAAPLACAGVTVWRAVIQSEVKPGEWLAMVGSGGGLGHLGVQFAKAKGLKVIGIDARDEGLELSRKCGADEVIDARLGNEKVAEEVMRITGGRGAESTVTISDHPTAAALGCAMTRMHGTMIQVAQANIRIKGSLVSSPAEAAEMLDTVAKHGIWVNKNVFHGLREIPKLLELVHSGKMAGKGVVVVDEGVV
ncbi:MAG: hypothetical protein Q9160_004132 [Pyrenula sp. 1 TL-2023]